MGAFSILGEVAKGFTQAAQTDQTRAFQQDMVAREGASKAIDSLIASGAVDQSQIPELLQRRMAIMTEPYKPYRPGKTPSWGKHADLSTLKYQAPTPPPQGMQPSQPQVGPGAGGVASPPPGTSGPPTPQASVGALPLNPSPLNAIAQPEVSFQPPTPPPTQGLRVLSPEERATIAGNAQATQERITEEARIKRLQALGLSSVQAAQGGMGKQILPEGVGSSKITFLGPDGETHFGRQLRNGSIIDDNGEIVPNAKPLNASIHVSADEAQILGLKGGEQDVDVATYEKAVSAATRPIRTTTTGAGVINQNVLSGKKDYVGPPAAVNAIAEGRLSLAQKQFERDTFGTLFGKDIPSSLVDASGNTLGWKSPSAPTATIKSQAQQAQDLVPLFREVKAEVNAAAKAGLLGPMQGRVSEIMTGKIGADNPQFAKLRALGSLTASGVLKAHFGARGGQQMYSHFEDLFNTGKMTAGDLGGALDGFSTFMSQYAKRVQTAGEKNQTPSKPPSQQTGGFWDGIPGAIPH